MERIKLKRNQTFLKTKKVVRVLQKILENKWENNCVFLDAGPVNLRSYDTNFSLKVSWL